jgi:hypothetical protein
MKMAAIWVLASCSLADIRRRLKGVFIVITLKMETVNLSETSVNTYQTSLRNIIEDGHLKDEPS